MKDKFEFYGIKTPLRKSLTKNFLKKHGNPSEQNLEKVVRDSWQFPEREFQYAGLDILEQSVKKNFHCNVSLFEYLVTTKSWWDTVDWLATRIIGLYFQKNPELIQNHIPEWNESKNMWLNRVAILFQLKYKRDTDETLLFNIIKSHSGSKEFFIQKAIGWALREYSKSFPEVVKDFVEENELAPLSKREALKVINRKK
jgi:3-methyladenine DNA glycosylase AlkD|tara:strand:- start:3224 stop:3820 length:597 start_codon:yes stop_codon:yes gene_type:complete